MRQHRRAPLVSLLLLLALAACGGAGDAPAPGAGSTPESAAPAETRIPRAPTAPDALPAALLGTAPAPAGQAVSYAPGDPAAAATWRSPKARAPSRR
jgi:hypothetical protein